MFEMKNAKIAVALSCCLAMGGTAFAATSSNVNPSQSGKANGTFKGLMRNKSKQYNGNQGASGNQQMDGSNQNQMMFPTDQSKQRSGGPVGPDNSPQTRCFGSNAQMNKPYRYNPGSSTIIKGTVEKVESVSYPDGPTVYVIVNTQEGKMTVVLGPANYYNRSNIALQPGDQVEVFGSSVYANGDEVIIASELRKNGRSLQLRDSHGNPFWK